MSYPPFWADPGCAQTGKKIFMKQCASCHTVFKDEGHAFGPNLSEVVGRKVGSVGGFSFRPEFKSVGEECANNMWTEANINKYLVKPDNFVPGVTMYCSSLKKSQQRVDLVEFLRRIGLISIEKKSLCDPGRREDNELLKRPDCYKARRILHDDEQLLIKSDSKKSQHTEPSFGDTAENKDSKSAGTFNNSGGDIYTKDNRHTEVEDECNVVKSARNLTFDEAKEMMED